MQTGRPASRSYFRFALTLLALGALVVLVVTQRSLIASSMGTLGHTNLIWLPAALALEWASIAAFGGK